MVSHLTPPHLKFGCSAGLTVRWWRKPRPEIEEICILDGVVAEPRAIDERSRIGTSRACNRFATQRT